MTSPDEGQQADSGGNRSDRAGVRFPESLT